MSDLGMLALRLKRHAPVTEIAICKIVSAQHIAPLPKLQLIQHMDEPKAMHSGLERCPKLSSHRRVVQPTSLALNQNCSTVDSIFSVKTCLL
jgi:hypothetical protein